MREPGSGASPRSLRDPIRRAVGFTREAGGDADGHGAKDDRRADVAELDGGRRPVLGLGSGLDGGLDHPGAERDGDGAEPLDDGAVPVVLGGDHSIAIGSVAGVESWARGRRGDIGVLWFDAHADMNTPETTPSGNIHGMPLAVALGHGAPELTQIGGFSPKVKEHRVVLIGARDLYVSNYDGTRVPISLVCRRDTPRDGSTPCVLYGYGSYETSMDPWFSIPRLSLVDRGVIFAVAHVRGGGELGGGVVLWNCEMKLHASPLVQVVMPFSQPLHPSTGPGPCPPSKAAHWTGYPCWQPE